MLHKCIQQDMRQRSLSDMAAVARALDDTKRRLERIVLAELLHRGLFLHRFAMKHGSIMNPSAATTPAKLVQDASDEITSSAVSSCFAKFIGTSKEELLATDESHVPWWKLLTRHLELSEFDLETADFHLRVSSRMAMHLKLTFEHIEMPHWWAAALLSTDARCAQEAACALHAHLQRKAAHELSSFERAVQGDDALWAELGNFCERLPPVQLWRGKGAYQHLMRFLAPRFLGNQDSVLGAEGIHSRWQDIIRKKHGVKHPLLNSLLKLGFALTDGGGLPDLDALLPHFTQARQADQWRYRALRVDGTVAPKFRRREMFLERFNLSTQDAVLLKGPSAAHGEPDAGVDARWANYCRSVLTKMNFFAFLTLKPDLYFFVGENKSMPGRDTRAESDALGRSLGVAWFEKHDVAAGGTIVRRVAREGPHMELQLHTLAELLRAAGFTLSVGVDDTARQVELALEATVMDHCLVRFHHVRETAATDDPFVFTLSEPHDAEQVFWGETEPAALTKIGLARRAEVQWGMNRAHLYANMDKVQLVHMFDPDFVPPAPKGRGEGPGVPKAKAKGKGPGAPKGKGKGPGAPKAEAKGPGDPKAKGKGPVAPMVKAKPKGPGDPKAKGKGPEAPKGKGRG